MSIARGWFPFADGQPLFPAYEVFGTIYQDNGQAGWDEDGEPHNLKDGVAGHGNWTTKDDTQLPDRAKLEINGPHDVIAGWMTIEDGDGNDVYHLEWVHENTP